MTRYGLLIQADKCIGCDMCFKACKDEFVGNDYPPYSAAQPDTAYGYGPGLTYGWPSTPSSAAAWVSPGHAWVKVEEQTSGTFPNVKVRFVPQPCMQCDSPPCVTAATGGAASVTKNGVVILDPKKSVNQQKIVSACPYSRIYWNAASNIPQKCTLCAHLTDQGKNPRCVDACPLALITFGDLDDPNSNLSKQVAALNAKLLNPEFGAKPRVYYTGLL